MAAAIDRFGQAPGLSSPAANAEPITPRDVAAAVLTSDGTVPADDDTVTINDQTYRFETTMAQANDVQVGVDSNATLDSLIAAVNGTGTPGTDYFAGTAQPTDVTAGARSGSGASATVTFSAGAGDAGAAYESTETSAHLSFGATTFVYGFSHVSRWIYVGSGGDLAVELRSGDALTLVAVPTGSLLPLRARRVASTGTTASDLVALW